MSDNPSANTPDPALEPLTYRAAGVDIEAGSRLVELIKPIAARTARPGLLGGLGGFGALFQVPAGRYREPVLVASTDGVGTKLKLAIESGRHDGVGIDLVAMCVNDLIVQGAEPLFFLDYFATGKLDVEVAAQVIDGIGRGCEEAGAALVGGETAEMPGMYAAGDYDLAGFAVGVVEKALIIDGSTVEAGDALIGVASSGPHSNGYSLIRRIIARAQPDLEADFHGANLADTLLAPTQIYVKPLLALLERVKIRAMAHITGGGLVENLPRVLPRGSRAVIDAGAWWRPPVFDWIQDLGQVPESEMYRTFNCGIGMVVCVPSDQVAAALEEIHRHGLRAWPVGTVEAGDAGGPPVVQILPR